MFESLSDRLTGALAGLRGKGRLTDADIDATAREIRLALLEADVALAVVKAFVDNIITPIIAAVFGKPDFGNLLFTINGSAFHYGLFINALVTFLLVAAAIYYVVVMPMPPPNVFQVGRSAS